MRTLKLICLSLLTVTAALAGASGQPSPTNINPALLYYQAFLMAPKTMSDADWGYLGSKIGREQKLPERFGQILAGYDNEFKLVRQAAQQKVPCDWGIDMSPGPGTQLPHLALVKAVDNSLEGIAAALDCSVGTVKSRLFHALDKFRGMSALSEQLGDVNTEVGVL